MPAGLTFSIWGVIYLGLIALVVYSFTEVSQAEARGVLEQLGPWFLVSCLANGAWIFAWHWQLVALSVLLMLGILGSLIAMYLRLGIGVERASPAVTWAVHVPISLYLGWITVATIANVTALAVDLGAPSFGTVPAALTVGMLATALGVTGAVLWTRRDLAYGLVVLWAFLGIFLKRAGSVEEGSALVSTAATGGLVVLGLALGLVAWSRFRPRRP